MTDLKPMLTELTDWARSRGRHVDTEMLEMLLDLRATYDEPDVTLWPQGSVTDLLVRLWPAKGVGDAPDPDALARTLESYLRFLRNTGRLASGSADPKSLAREARRAAPRMAEAGEDRSSWSPGKILADYGATIGLPFDDAASEDDLRARLELVNASWNALPVHDRRRLMPDPDDEDLSGRARAEGAYGVDDAAVALIMSMRHELPRGSLPEPRVTAPLARASGLFAEVNRLLDVIGPMAPVTSTGVLKLARARDVHDELGLEEWEESYFTFCGRVQDRDWRSARDLTSLNRLWAAAKAMGWIRVGVTVATVDRPSLDDDDDALLAGIQAAIGITLEEMTWHDEGVPLLYPLLRSYVTGCDRVTWKECGEFLADWELPPSLVDRLVERDPEFKQSGLRRARASAFLLADSGTVDVDDTGLALTPLGDVFVTALLKYLER